MNNSKLRTATMFIVAAVLVAGTISMTAPSSFAQKYYGEKEYKGYEDSYGKDYDKKKASEISIQKVKCNNIILNGINTDNGPSGGMMDGMTDENDGTWTEDGQWLADGQKGSNSIDNNIVNICINKNNEIVEVADEEERTCEDCKLELTPKLQAELDTLLAEGVTIGPIVLPVGSTFADLCEALEQQNSPVVITLEEIVAVIEELEIDLNNEDIVSIIKFLLCLEDLDLIEIDFGVTELQTALGTSALQQQNSTQ